MKFSPTILIALAGFAVAAPAAESPPPPPTCPGTDPEVPGGRINPTVVSNYEVWTGAIRYNTGRGKVFKDQRTTDISTLVTFVFPAAAAGKQCSINLALSAAATQTGAKEIDIFSSLAPAPGPRSSWGPGNGRNQHLGRIRVANPGTGVYLSGYPVAGKSFPCPPAGTTAGYEYVATDDITDTTWVQSASVGAYISYS